MKKTLVSLMVIALFLRATEVRALDWEDDGQRALGLITAVFVHEGSHMINITEGQNQYWQIRDPITLTAFDVRSGYDTGTVVRHASMSGLVGGTNFELVVSSTKMGTKGWRDGLTFGTATYQAGYPLLFLFLGKGIDIEQYERFGGNEAVKFGFLVVGSYRLWTVYQGSDPLMDGNGWELSPSVDSERTFWINLTGRF